MVGFDTYYQLRNNSKPYVLIAFGQGHLSYHGENRDVSKNTLNFLECYITATITKLSTFSSPIQSTSINKPNIKFIHLIQQILELILNYLNNSNYQI